MPSPQHPPTQRRSSADPPPGVFLYRTNADKAVHARIDAVRENTRTVLLANMERVNHKDFLVTHFDPADDVAHDQAFTRGRRARTGSFDDQVYIATLLKALRSAATLARDAQAENALAAAEKELSSRKR